MIKSRQQQYSLLYDTDCCDMVSKYDAIKMIGNRPVPEFHCGDAEVKTIHGIYRVKLPFYNGSLHVHTESICQNCSQ